MQYFGHEAVEIEICEKLACQVADRQTTATNKRRKEIVVIEVSVDRLLHIWTSDLLGFVRDLIEYGYRTGLQRRQM